MIPAKDVPIVGQLSCLKCVSGSEAFGSVSLCS